MRKGQEKPEDYRTAGGRKRSARLMLRAAGRSTPEVGAGMGNPAARMSEHQAVAHKDMANAIRALAMDAVEKAKSGHPGMPMGMADVATVLFTRFLKFDASAPSWPDRDRFVLSAGHGSMLLYALLHLTGYPGMTLEELANFRQLGSKTAGHPEYGHGPGIETTTGPLGQGLANAVGMALAERILNARLGDAIVDHYTYVLAGDGCLMEGISQEAISLAGHLKLNKLIVLFDDNQISIDGPTSLAVSDDQLSRFRASGWNAVWIDGHDPGAIAFAVEGARRSDRPTLIACKTIIGYGAPTKQGKASTHGEPLGPDEIKGAREKLGWAHAPFEVPSSVLAAWRAAGSRGVAQRQSWEQRAGKLDAGTRTALGDPMDGLAMEVLAKSVAEAKAEFAATPPKIATRVASQKVLEKLVPALPCLIGGSADLTGSNGTRTKQHRPIAAGSFDGNYLHYGVREHAMAAAMNGMALHGGVVPYGGTFLVFTDYCRPAIRLSALMGQRVIYVMTHDSIGLGEDGPTHQPVEHLASLRAMPNLNVFRPADPIETAECWELALKAKSTPSILALTRQAVPALRTTSAAQNLCAKGAYVVAEAAGGKRGVTLLATGSEVGVAMEARELLAQDGIRAAVISMPCWELFAAQPENYRAGVLGSAPRVGVEAALGFGWERWLGDGGAFVGMDGFGASAPAAKLFTHFGVTAAKVADAAGKLLASG
jgi:transketolase